MSFFSTDMTSKLKLLDAIRRLQANDPSLKELR
jgi:hypothetical protein